MTAIRILNAALQRTPETLVLRGTIDPASLDLIQIGEYQREVLADSKIDSISEDYNDPGAVQDINLGMRGELHQQIDPTTFDLIDPVYVLDGLQRLTAAKRYRDEKGGLWLGATIRFGTTEAWERERFLRWGLTQTRIGANVALRNLCVDWPVVMHLHQLCADPTFVLADRICWNQKKRKGARAELMTAMQFLGTIAQLHHFHGANISTHPEALARGLQRLADRIGIAQLEQNVRAFYGYVDGWWGLRAIEHIKLAVHLKGACMLALAQILNGYVDFWRGNRLFIDVQTSGKFKSFNMAEPSVERHCGSSAVMRDLLLMHINKGRRVNRLTPRLPDLSVVIDDSQTNAG